MKTLLTISGLTLIAVSPAFVVPSAATNGALQHRFIFAEYDQFHEVLHPLEHEALPKRDFLTIRTKASQVVSRGKAIVKLGVPESGTDPDRKAFAKQRKKFDKALARFRSDATTGNDHNLKVSFSAVHDSFETLAELLTRLYPGGMPPIISLNCPDSKAQAGSTITLTASASEAKELLFSWVSTGKIVTGQGTRTITVDTSGLAGQTISITVEVNDGSGHIAATECEVQVAP